MADAPVPMSRPTMGSGLEVAREGGEFASMWSALDCVATSMEYRPCGDGSEVSFVSISVTPFALTFAVGASVTS